MPAWGTLTLVEAAWALGFTAAGVLAFLTYRLAAGVRRTPPVPGVSVAGQNATADYFVTLTLLLIVKALAGALLGVYAGLLPAPPVPPPAWLAAYGSTPGTVLICVLGVAVIWTSIATYRYFRAVVNAPDETPDKGGKP